MLCSSTTNSGWRGAGRECQVSPAFWEIPRNLWSNSSCGCILRTLIFRLNPKIKGYATSVRTKSRNFSKAEFKIQERRVVAFALLTTIAVRKPSLSCQDGGCGNFLAAASAVLGRSLAVLFMHTCHCRKQKVHLQKYFNIHFHTRNSLYDVFYLMEFWSASFEPNS